MRNTSVNFNAATSGMKNINTSLVVTELLLKEFLIQQEKLLFKLEVVETISAQVCREVDS